MLAEVGADELTLWAAAYRISPWGEERDNLHAGIVAAAIINAASALGGGKGQTMRPGDFALQFGPPKDATDWDARREALKAKLKALARATGGEVN